MRLGDSILHKLFGRYTACQTREELSSFIDTTPEAFDPELHQLISSHVQWAQMDESVPPENRRSIRASAKYFFVLLGDRIATMTEMDQSCLPDRQSQAITCGLDSEAIANCILSDADEALGQSRTQKDLVRVATRTILNLIIAEQTSPYQSLPEEPDDNNDESSFLRAWLPVVERLLEADDSLDVGKWEVVHDVLLQHGLQKAASYLNHWISDLGSHRRVDLPTTGMSRCTLHKVYCSTCGIVQWVEFWNIIHRDDTDLVSAISERRLNGYECPICRQGPCLFRKTLLENGNLRTSFLMRSLLYHDPLCGTVFKPPDFITRRDPRNDKIIEWNSLVLLEVALADSQSIQEGGMLPTLVAYSWDEFYTIVARFEDGRKWADNTFTFRRFTAATIFLMPLATQIRNGEMTLDKAKEIIKHTLRLPDMWPEPLVIWRDYWSADAGQAIILALLAIVNAAAGFHKESALCWMNAAVQSWAAGRPAESLQFISQMDDQLSLTTDLEEEFSDTLTGQAHLLRANLQFTLGNQEKGLVHMREVLTIHKRQVDRARESGNERVIWEEELEYASALKTYGTHIRHFDLLDAYRTLVASLELCSDLEKRLHLFREQPDLIYTEYRSGLYHTMSGAFNNLGNLMLDFRRWGVLVAWLTARSEGHDDTTRRAGLEKTLQEQGITSEMLITNTTTFAAVFLADKERKGIWGWVRRQVKRLRRRGKTPSLLGTLADISQQAYRYYRLAYELSTTHGSHRFAAVQAMNLAACHRELGNTQEVLKFCQLAEQHARESHDIKELGGSLSLHGRMLIESGRSSEAFEKLKSAYLELTKMRQYLLLDDLRITAGKLVDPILGMIAETLSDKAPDEWISVLETMKSASLWLALQYGSIRPAVLPVNDPDVRMLLSIENQIELARASLFVDRTMETRRRRSLGMQHPAGSDAEPVPPLDLEDLQRKYEDQLQKVLLRHPRFARWLADVQPQFPETEVMVRKLHDADPNAAFVGLWTHKGEVLAYGFVPDGDATRYFALRIPIMDRLQQEGASTDGNLDRFMAEYCENIRSLWKEPDKVEAFRDRFGGPLYRTLWQPIQAELRGAARVVVSGHGPLHAAPWGTMWDGQSYLIEQCSFNHTFSLNILLATAPRPPSFQSPEVLAMGPPPAVESQLELDASRQEIRELEQVVGQVGGTCRAYMDRDANSANLFAYCPSATIIHIASHADFNESDPWQSSLRLAPHNAPAPGGASGRLTMSQIAEYLNLDKTELVVLSACATGLSRVLAGDEVLGLVRGFHIAGCPRVVASLWEISDNSTRIVMKRFYEHLLKEGRPIGESLRLAQVDLLRDTSLPHSSSPFEWGAFVLFGA